MWDRARQEVAERQFPAGGGGPVGTAGHLENDEQISWRLNPRAQRYKRRRKDRPRHAVRTSDPAGEQQTAGSLSHA